MNPEKNPRIDHRSLSLIYCSSLHERVYIRLGPLAASPSERASKRVSVLISMEEATERGGAAVPRHNNRVARPR